MSNGATLCHSSKASSGWCCELQQCGLQDHSADVMCTIGCAFLFWFDERLHCTQRGTMVANSLGRAKAQVLWLQMVALLHLAQE